MMRNWTIGKRIIVGFGAVLTIMAMLGAFSALQMLAIRGDAREIAANLPMLRHVSVLATGARDNMTVVYRHIGAQTAAEKKALEEEMKAARAVNSAALEAYSELVDDEEAAALLADLNTKREAASKKRSQILELSRGIDTPEAAVALLARARDELQPLVAQYAAAIDALWALEESESQASAAAIATNSGRTTVLTVIAVAVALALGIGLSLGIARGINTVLRRVSRELGDGSRQVVAAATQVASAAQSLAQGASEQAASIEQTSASIEEMSSVTAHNADNADKVNGLARQARDAAERGADDMRRMSEAMSAIQSGSDDIARIIKTIDEIAFQTNILALNAAVEAARAGEAGRGFAVVAEEVRALAQRSAQAARESSGRIGEAVERTHQGVDINAKVAEALNEIVSHAREVDELAESVAGASRQQSVGISQVNLAVGQMDKVTQSNAAGAEQSASAAEELNAQAEAMRVAVAELELLAGVGR